MVNKVFACTCPPLAPVKVNNPFNAIPDPPVMVPADEETVTELLVAEDELAQQVSFPSCELVVALQAPPVNWKRM